jgi:eukaryotic-like serine/threonine-protein kinase
MAPEQAEGLPAGPSADLYSLALVLYEALTGVNPLASVGQRTRRQGAQLPPLRRQRRDLPRALAHGLDQALRPRPGERGALIDLRRALSSSLDLVGDEPGIVAAPWPTAATRVLTGDGRAAADPVGGAWAPLPDAGAAPERESPGLASGREMAPDAGARPAARDRWPPRALGGAAAAAMTAWLAVHLLGSSALAPATAGLIAAAAALVFPRLGWAALTVALSAAAVIAHRPGGALVLIAAAALPVLLLPAAPTTWPLAVIAVALGLIGLAGAWPALAGRAATPWRRAVLGALGWVWLALGSALAGRALYLPQPPGAPSPSAWPGSVLQTVQHVLGPLVTSGALAGAGVWALAAAVTPWLASGRTAALDVVRVGVWAALTPLAAGAAVLAVHGSDRLGSPPTAVAGAIAAAVVVLAPSALAAWRRAVRPAGASARVP